MGVYERSIASVIDKTHPLKSAEKKPFCRHCEWKWLTDAGADHGCADSDHGDALAIDRPGDAVLGVRHG